MSALEQRRLLSSSFFIGGIEVQIEGAELRIIGTNGPDDFSVEIEGDILRLRKSEATGGESGGADMLPDPVFPETSPDVPIRRITIDLGAGDDKLTFSAMSAWEDVPRGPSRLPNTYRMFPVIRGGDGNDEVVAGGDFTFVFGDGGDDFIRGGKRVFGGEGDDTLVGPSSAKYGGDGNDFLSGSSGGFNDGRSLLDGGAGNDTLVGGENDDTLIAGPGNDTLDGSDGRDLIWLYGDRTGGRVNLRTGQLSTSSSVATLLNIENVLGGDGPDEIIGSDGRNVLYGGAGEDSLFGGDGKDTLVGGAGRDLIDGGDDGDLLIAGLDGKVDVIRGGGGFDIALLDELDDAQELERHRTSVAELLELLSRT